ncbi:MAG: HlyD family type I secretion periplasmic adaptor subunit [Gammaproteobacteria bacterium]
MTLRRRMGASPDRESGSRGAPRLILYFILVFFVAFLVWARWAELDQVSRAPGSVIPSDRLQVVQSADGGVVKEILVKAGQKVTQGQLLVRLDRVKIAAAVDESRSRQAALLAQLARLNAELFDRPLEFPPELADFPELTDNQSRLYEKRRSALQGELRTLGSLLRLASQELRMTEPLLKSGDVSRAEVLRLQRQVADLEGQISAKRNRYLQELQTELAKAQEELNSVSQTRRQREDQLSYTDLVAPTDGIVKNIRLTTVGAVLRPGDEMLQIVPTDAPLIVEAKVKPKDIGFIRVGQPAAVKFDAYDYLTYGRASGKVTFISPDTLTDQGPKGEEQVFYRVQVEVDISPMRPRRTGEVIELQPGMVAMVEIKTGENTVLRYLLKPLVKTLDNALSER